MGDGNNVGREAELAVVRELVGGAADGTGRVPAALTASSGRGSP